MSRRGREKWRDEREGQRKENVKGKEGEGAVKLGAGGGMTSTLMSFFHR